MAPNIWTVQPVRPVPDSISQVLSDEIECAQIRRAARQTGLERPMLWSQDPRAAGLVDRLPVAGIVYDLTDDWAAFETDPTRRARIQARIETLGRRADLVLACSRRLEDAARAWSDRVCYLPNAVEAPSDVSPLPADLELLPRPRLGYAGTLHSARLDINLLKEAAESRPGWSFVLVGPDLLEDADRFQLFSAPNVHYLGIRPHSEVRSYLYGLDVCLMPNRVTDFTHSLDPLKIYEYLAAGRPVVATPAGITSELEHHIAIARTPEELVNQAQRALDEDGPRHAAARRASVADATWDARAETIERALKVQSASAPTSEVSVVIVSFNTRDVLERCLRDVHQQTGLSMQTIVVDNASMDGSRELVREQFPSVELVELPENAGFARANNVALGLCRGEHVLLLNSDAFLHPGSLSELIAAAKRHPRAGAVGPRLLNPDGTLQRSAWPFPHAGRLLLEAFGLHRPLRSLGMLEDLGLWGHNEERSVDFLIGACLLLRADALEEVGGFDEAFWLYGEEADLQRRLACRGWSVIFTPRAAATHVGGASSKESLPRLRHFYSGQRRFLQKHEGRSAWAIARFALVVGSILRGRWNAARVGMELSGQPVRR